MADVAAGYEIDYVFGDVGGVVADALEVARHENQIERRLDRARILEHERQQLTKDLGLQRVQAVVGIEHRLRQGGVAEMGFVQERRRLGAADSGSSVPRKKAMFNISANR